MSGGSSAVALGAASDAVAVAVTGGALAVGCCVAGSVGAGDATGGGVAEGGAVPVAGSAGPRKAAKSTTAPMTSAPAIPATA